MQNALKMLAGKVSTSFLLCKGKALWQKNQDSWNLHLSFMEKAHVTAYLVLQDFSNGKFPPTFMDKNAAHASEIAYRDVLPGVETNEVIDALMRKPFWPGKIGQIYLKDYLKLVSLLEQLKLEPGSKVLELGCGSGWMAEFLATTGYDVTATTLAPNEVEDCEKRVLSLADKNIQAKLEFLASPMEDVRQNLRSGQQFDCAFVYEALHHAFSWEQTIHSISECLKSGGWLILSNEPNWFHTIRAYRGAVLSNTHEIGFRKSQVIKCLKNNGFGKIEVVHGKMGFYTRPFWIAAQLEKPQ